MATAAKQDVVKVCVSGVHNVSLHNSNTGDVTVHVEKNSCDKKSQESSFRASPTAKSLASPSCSPGTQELCTPSNKTDSGPNHTERTTKKRPSNDIRSDTTAKKKIIDDDIIVISDGDNDLDSPTKEHGQGRKREGSSSQTGQASNNPIPRKKPHHFGRRIPIKEVKEGLNDETDGKGNPSRWYIRAGKFKMIKKPQPIQKKEGTVYDDEENDRYFFHCYLWDKGRISIYLSVFLPQNKCKALYKQIKSSSIQQPLCFHDLRVEKQEEQYKKPGYSNVRLTYSDRSEVFNLYE